MRVHVLPVLVSLVIAAPAFAQSAAFTYQGELKNNAALATGPHDFVFRVYDALVAGNQVGVSVCADNVPVVSGRFTAQLPIVSAFAPDVEYFIEIDVRPDTGLDCSNITGLTTLQRQPITPVPRAYAASVANALTAPDGSPRDAVIVDNDGRVGIGTASPTHSLHIANDSPTIALHDTGANSQQVGYISYRDGANVERAWVGYGTPGSPDFSIVNARAGGDIVLLNLGTGRVGIGTDSPAATLDVRGDIRLGSSGQYFANSVEENLRTIRGSISTSGAITAGTGFTVSHPATGTYTISFTSAFASTPTIIACTSNTNNAKTAVVNGPTTFAVQILVYNSSGVATDGGVYFTAIGPR